MRFKAQANDVGMIEITVFDSNGKELKWYTLTGLKPDAELEILIE